MSGPQSDYACVIHEMFGRPVGDILDILGIITRIHLSRTIWNNSYLFIMITILLMIDSKKIRLFLFTPIYWTVIHHLPPPYILVWKAWKFLIFWFHIVYRIGCFVKYFRTTHIIDQSTANIIIYGFIGHINHVCDAPCITNHIYLILMHKM